MSPEEAGERAESRLRQAMMLTAEKALERIAARTPVLTGKAQASWHIVDNGDIIEVVSDETEYIKVLEFGEPAKATQYYKKSSTKLGYRKGQLRKKARVARLPHYMVTATTNESQQIAIEVAEELNA